MLIVNKSTMLVYYSSRGGSRLPVRSSSTTTTAYYPGRVVLILKLVVTQSFRNPLPSFTKCSGKAAAGTMNESLGTS